VDLSRPSRRHGRAGVDSRADRMPGPAAPGQNRDPFDRAVANLAAAPAVHCQSSPPDGLPDPAHHVAALKRRRRSGRSGRRRNPALARILPARRSPPPDPSRAGGRVATHRAGHDVGAGRHQVPSDQETGADHLTAAVEHPHDRSPVHSVTRRVADLDPLDTRSHGW
jgi:hypothetical protein